MGDQGNQFKSRQEVLDDILAARQTQQAAWESWFAIPDLDSTEYEAARVVYINANSEVNRLIEIDNHFRVK